MGRNRQADGRTHTFFRNEVNHDFPGPACRVGSRSETHPRKCNSTRGCGESHLRLIHPARPSSYGFISDSTVKEQEGTRARSRGAIRPSFASAPLKRQRVQETPGARCTRGLACSVENTRVSHHRFTGTPGVSCAMVLTVSFVLSLVTGLCCHHHRAENSARLERQRRGVRTTRLRRPPTKSFVACQRHARPDGVHRIPHPTSVTIAKRPSWRARDSAR